MATVQLLDLEWDLVIEAVSECLLTALEDGGIKNPRAVALSDLKQYLIQVLYTAE